MSDDLILLRKELHQNPELSGAEKQTARRICSFIENHQPSEIIEGLGGNGLAIIYTFSDYGPVIAFRCELDALPIHETNKFVYMSRNKGISHKCGHDGHMAIVAGLSKWLSKQTFAKGKVILLFQPAEETGKGAQKVLADKRIKRLNIDYIFALHNIPGEAMHSVIVMDKGFSAEVQSFSIQLNGIESHAAEPENGINPSITISQLIHEFDELNEYDPNSTEFALLTPIYIKMGAPSYGISPAKGELHYTIRTWSTAVMDKLKSSIVNITLRICASNELSYEMDWFEYFPSSTNNQHCIDLVKQAARQTNLSIIHRSYSFKFGEDFGWFTKSYNTAMFGLGAGINTPALHNPGYDFPDELIESGVKIFSELLNIILK